MTTYTSSSLSPYHIVSYNYEESRNNSKAPCSNNLAATKYDDGRWIEQTSDGNIILSSFVNYLRLDCNAGGCNKDYNDVVFKDAAGNPLIPKKFDYFQQSDVVLLKIGNTPANSGTIINGKNIYHMSGGDFIPMVKETYSGDFAVIGTTANDDDMNGYDWTPGHWLTPEDKSLLVLIDVQLTAISYNMNWKKLFLGPNDNWCGCGFGLCVTKDGGFLVCGNNGWNNDNYMIIKLSNDCQTTNLPIANASTHTRCFDNSDCHIVVTKTWSSISDIPNDDHIIKGPIIIESGVVLKIKDLIVQFASYSNLYESDYYSTYASAPFNAYKHIGIIVRPGGKLILDNATLTNYSGCSTHYSNMVYPSDASGAWDGIFVEGSTASEHSSPASHGLIQMYNGSIIENAKSGIVLGVATSNNGNITGGGILQAYGGSTFLNNRSCVTFMPFSDGSYNNPSQISNCNFKCNASIPGYMGYGLLNCIAMIGTRGILLTSNSFIYHPSFTPIDGYRGYGIGVFDASANITAYSSSTLNEFQYLTGGIITATSGTIGTSSIQGCHFLDVQEGITLNGTFNDAVGCNIFDIDDNLKLDPTRVFNNNNLYIDHLFPSTPILPYAYGIYTSEASGFTLAHNAFNFNIINSSTYCFGTVSDNSGDNGGFIKVNTVRDNNPGTPYTYGMEALGYNPALYITCNSYTDGAKFLNQEWFVTPYSNVTPGFYYSDNFPDHYSNGNNAGNYFYNYPPGTTKNIYCESVVPLNYNIEYNGQPTSNFNVSVISGAHALYPGACDWACMGEGGTVYGGGGGVGLVAPPVGNIGNHVYNQSVAMVDYLRKLSIAKGSDSVAEYLSKSDNPQSIKISGLHQLINGTGKGTGSEYTNLIKEAKQSGASIYKLSSEHLSRLTDLANSNTTDKIYAQNLLSINTGRPSLRKPLLLPKNKTNKVSQNANTTIETISSNNLFSIYPNPSSASITATLAIPNPGNKIYTVELYSLLGVKLIAKEVDPTITKQVIFDLSYLTTGVYFAKLISSDGELIGVKSFVVNKN